jgi:hypothetical protein
MKSASFNRYDFLSGTDGIFPKSTFPPLHCVPPFWALMHLESSVCRFPISKKKLADVAGMYAQISKALTFICHVVVKTDGLARSGRGRFGLGKRNNTGSVDGPLSFLLNMFVSVISLPGGRCGKRRPQWRGGEKKLMKSRILLQYKPRFGEVAVRPRWRGGECTVGCNTRITGR